MPVKVNVSDLALRKVETVGGRRSVLTDTGLFCCYAMGRRYH